MALALRHRADPLPALDPRAGLTIHEAHDPALLAGLQARPLSQIADRFADGHRAYVAFIDATPVAFGWVATYTARIGELQATLTLPPAHRYLWNFVTLPEHRGLSIYPRLLEGILERESASAEWFWIAYAPENHASAAGIARAGFSPVADLSFERDGRVAFRETLAGTGPAVRTLLGVPEAHGELSPCWRCVRAGRPGMRCAPGTCRCDYQRPERACAA